jgi:hypothetical protein
MARDDTYLMETIHQILRLRRSERLTDGQVRADLAAVREFLEGSIGPTVRPAAAARALGVSHTGLNRWLDKNEIASVMTPEGRREIPVRELVGLIEDAEQLNVRGSRRPLAAVLNKRHRSAEEIDIDRLLPPRRERGHRAAELQALAYHRLIAERMDDALAEEARRKLQNWRASGRIHPRWADEWERVLALPLSQLQRAISADTARARELRQTSPFAGALPEHERRRLLRAVEQRVSA